MSQPPLRPDDFRQLAQFRELTTAELRPLLEEQGLTVQISQLQAWRGQPLSDGTRLAPMNPTLILKGTKSHQ